MSLLANGCDRLEVFSETTTKTSMGGETSGLLTEGRFITGTLQQISSSKSDTFDAQGKKDFYNFYSPVDPLIGRGHALLVVKWGSLEASDAPGADNTGLFQTLEVIGVKRITTPGCMRMWHVMAEFKSLGDRMIGTAFGFAGVAFGTDGYGFGHRTL